MTKIILTAPEQTARWLDERGLCRLAHSYLAPRAYRSDEPVATAEDLPDFRACQSYHRGRCRATGCKAACVFTQLADDEGWALVRQYRRLPGDAGVCLAAHEAELLTILQHQAGPQEPPR
jgi:hypothetical protein